MKRNDLILIGGLLIIGILVIIIINFTKSTGSEVLITVNGKDYKTISLKENITYTIKQDNGDTNTFTIKNGYVDMTDASCPDKLCVKHKDIHYNGETIVCLPNKVVLQVINGEENGLDAVAE